MPTPLPSMPQIQALRVGPYPTRAELRRVAERARVEAVEVLAFCDADEAFEREHSLPPDGTRREGAAV